VLLTLEEHPVMGPALTRRLRALRLEAWPFTTAAELLEGLPVDRPAGVVCLADPEGRSDLALLQELRARSPRLPLVLLSTCPRPELGLSAMRAGAADFLTDPVSEATLSRAVESALQAAIREWERALLRREVHRRAARMTPRERDVFDLVVSGLLNKQIAHELGASEKTIKVHRARVMQKMGARSLAELVRLAVRGDVRPHEPTSVGQLRR